MANYSEGDEVNIKYKKLADEGKAYLALVAHYPDYENPSSKTAATPRSPMFEYRRNFKRHASGRAERRAIRGRQPAEIDRQRGGRGLSYHCYGQRLQYGRAFRLRVTKRLRAHRLAL